jgi:uncharacterized protein (DUF302 family)
MNQQGRVVSFVIEERFDIALRMVRRALAQEGLRVPHEFDTAARVRQELGVGLKQNIVLYVDDPIRLLEATVMNAAGALFVPEPVALSTLDKGCRVSVRSIEAVLASDLPASLRGAILNLHERIVAAIQRIAHKESAAAGMPTRTAVPA